MGQERTFNTYEPDLERFGQEAREAGMVPSQLEHNFRATTSSSCCSHLDSACRRRQSDFLFPLEFAPNPRGFTAFAAGHIKRHTVPEGA